MMNTYDDSEDRRERTVVCIFDEQAANLIVNLVHEMASLIDAAFFNQRRAVKDDEMLNRELTTMKEEIARCKHFYEE